MAINGVDPAAKTPSRIRRDWNRLNKGSIASTISLVQPIAFNGSNAVTLNVATTSGLTSSGTALSLKLDTNPGLTLSATGLKILLPANSGLTLGASGLVTSVDNTTMQVNVSGQLAVKKIDSGQLGIITTKGDILCYSVAPTRLAVGTDGYVLTADSTQGTGLRWGTITPGMSNPMTSPGDIIYGGTAGLPTRLATGSNGQVLTLVAGSPAWADASSSGGLTSVGLIEGSLFTVINTPLTANGNITLALNNAAPNLVFAGPATGSAATPTFRALVPLDVMAATYPLVFANDGGTPHTFSTFSGSVWLAPFYDPANYPDEPVVGSVYRITAFGTWNKTGTPTYGLGLVIGGTEMSIQWKPTATTGTFHCVSTVAVYASSSTASYYSAMCFVELAVGNNNATVNATASSVYQTHTLLNSTTMRMQTVMTCSVSSSSNSFSQYGWIVERIR